MVLHILIALVAGLEVYPGGISKPGRVIGVTVALVIVKSLVTHLLYLLAQYPSRYATWALPCYILFGIATTTAKIAELLLIARFVPKSKIESPRDVFNICGPVVVEVLSALLMCHWIPQRLQYLPWTGGRYCRELQFPRLRRILDERREKCAFKELVIGSCSAPFSSFF